jgi:hypothetical protein
MLQGKVEYCQRKYWPTGILLNGSGVISFGIKSLLEFRYYTNYPSKIVKFQRGL